MSENQNFFRFFPFLFRTACMSRSSSRGLATNPPQLLPEVLLWIWKWKSSLDFAALTKNCHRCSVRLRGVHSMGHGGQLWGPPHAACHPFCPSVKRRTSAARTDPGQSPVPCVPTAVDHFHRVSGRKSSWMTHSTRSGSHLQSVCKLPWKIFKHHSFWTVFENKCEAKHTAS